jgi:hypothetical protein
MSDIKLLGNGSDIDLTGLQLSLVKDNLAIAQEMQIACRFFLAEWALDKRVGINFLGRPELGDQDPTRLLGRKGTSAEEVSTEYRRALLSIPGVTNVVSVKTVLFAGTDASTRTARIDWAASVDSGAVVEGSDALVIHI